jgi:MarR family transcriptional regulator, organic hydroperoxide resistance regulator
VHLNPTKAKKLQSFYGEVNQRMAALLDETPERELRSVLNLLSNASRAEEPPASQRRQ